MGHRGRRRRRRGAPPVCTGPRAIVFRGISFPLRIFYSTVSLFLFSSLSPFCFLLALRPPPFSLYARVAFFLSLSGGFLALGGPFFCAFLFRAKKKKERQKTKRRTPPLVLAGAAIKEKKRQEEKKHRERMRGDRWPPFCSAREKKSLSRDTAKAGRENVFVWHATFFFFEQEKLFF